MSETSVKAGEIAEDLVAAALGMGAAEVIVLVGMPDGLHSAYSAKYSGACLPVRGLLEFGAEDIRGTCVFDNHPNHKTNMMKRAAAVDKIMGVVCGKK